MRVRGWVYIITIKSMPGLIKVGYSLKDPVLRANELDNNGSPHSYIIQYEVLVYEPREIEQRVHFALSDFRETKGWFRCSLSESVTAIRKIIGDGKILLETIGEEIESLKGKRYDLFIDCSNGTVLDKWNNLMWAIKQNEGDINWADAKKYCENYRAGGYTDWRMPTLDELAELYNAGKNSMTKMVKISGNPWAVGKRSEEIAWLDFNNGNRYWLPRSDQVYGRALPVRSVKQVI